MSVRRRDVSRVRELVSLRRGATPFSGGAAIVACAGRSGCRTVPFHRCHLGVVARQVEDPSRPTPSEGE